MSQKFTQSNIRCIRTFNAWYLELQMRARAKQIQIEIDKKEAELYYNGGYTPKTAILSHLRVPINVDLFA